MGAESIAQLMERIDFDDEEILLREAIEAADGRRPLSAQRKQKAIKRLKILSAFNRRNPNEKRINDPRAMILDAVPVIPPDLRPMVQLDGGRFATSDLNDLYRRVINRNNRLKRLLDLGAPEIIVNNEKRMLQEAVDALFDNGRRGRPVTGPGNRPLKSLSDMLKGKQGRFRQNLLGKRVDYSGRSVIVVGPTLKLHQCGLPKLMALELFKPFVMKRLDDLDIAPNIKSAKRMVERRRSEVWDVLEEIIKEHPVLLNRAPTLHRLGIQAFEPVLVDGKAIQIHPLVCAAFNADFDGDQMAVHLPLSAEAQAEARVLMLSANNILSPADGRPMTVPSQDMIIGGYYLTELRGEFDGQEEPVFRHFDEIERAVTLGLLELHRPIIWRTDALALEDGGHQVTTAGRVLFNKALPEGFPYVNRTVKKSDMGDIVGELSDGWRTNEVAAALDRIKDLTYKYATKSGLTISIDDVRVPPDKAEILERYEGEAERVENQFRRGIITDGERRQKEVEIWTSATEEVRASLERELKATVFNPIDMMVGSGARGNMMQVRQIAAIRGLVANPRGDIIPRPIKSSYREGLAMLEYFISTPGARKGLVDTALRTADSGYLTRRLVDVAQELIINEESPFERSGPVLGLWLEDIGPDTADKRTYLETRLFSRCLAQDVELTDGVMEAGTLIGDEEMVILRDDPKVTRVQVLSPLTDNSEFGVSAKAYGSSLATRQMIEVGEAVGVIAAQSIGEPGTQLTMRTFHTGGVAGSDIAGGLPRVVELFEARTPKGKATLASRTGVVRIGDDDGRGREILVVGDDGEEETHTVSTIARLAVVDGQEVKAGDPLVDGPRDPKELLEIRGVRETQQYLVEEVQKVYREQGVSIHDKHIELIIRQMTRRVLVGEPGESVFLPGEQVDQRVYAEVNRSLVQEGQRPAEARPVIMGITKASLATDSWLSAASFQETTRVLTEAAIESRRDDLKGLKENIIIGKLIPAGTGQGQYRNIDTTAPDYEPMEFFTSDEDLDPAEWLATIGSEEGGDVVQLGDAG
jgi:DNA-directed RNA polymerase subunit beta'